MDREGRKNTDVVVKGAVGDPHGGTALCLDNGNGHVNPHM